jgi:adenine-specific DNA-methyltransferase
MPPRKKSAGPTPVEAIRHQDSRVNIPTEELADFVAEQETAPPALLYPRDPSLDPQLVWRGKDAQDRADLQVPVVPVYIQEKVHPKALIENLRDTAKAGEKEPELSLFADFNGIEDFSKKVDFYRWQNRWTNRLILGDSLLVMTSLAEKEGLKGQVQTIYVDPPYGIRFGSNWQVSTRKRDVKDGKLEDLTRQPEQIKAFRDTWELGIHSYLAYLRDRFVVARELLTETGSVFVQIGDENVHLVRSVMDEVFGSENFVAQISFRKKTMPLGAKYLESISDNLIWYAKNFDKLKFRRLHLRKSAEGDTHWNAAQRPDGTRRGLSREEIEDHRRLERKERVFQLVSLYPAGVNKSGLFRVTFRGRPYDPPPGNSWGTNEHGMRRLIVADRIEPYSGGETIRYVLFHDDYDVTPVTSFWPDTSAPSDMVYAVQTNTKVVQRCLLMTTDPGDLVLDPTCGSGTTAFVAEQWGRRWITADTSRVALALARTRLMTAKYPYYLLADTMEGAAKEAELAGRVEADAALAPPRYEGDVRKGFVYRRVPHVTLKSIANNQEIDAIHERFAARLDPLRERLGKLAGKPFEEWEVPREPAAGWPAEAGAVLAEWWTGLRKRQAEIDASIARQADTEVLVDQPYEDPRRLRVTGPFTVESLAPHRVLATDEERPASERAAETGEGAGRYESTILDNLRKAGVQNTRRNERLAFDRLETFPGRWLQAVGEFTENANDGKGTVRRVTISLGPEHNTVGPTQIREAAKEAMRGVGFDLLVVLGFAFDPHAAETAREIGPDLPIGDPAAESVGFVAEGEQRFGRLPVLLVRMNPDLAMGDELLKKTGAGNLFMVFGEPDIDLRRRADGRYEVEIRGLDVYDPTTGVVRSSSTDDIACWLLDTAYDEESFFVRHAYFTGAGDPYEKLKRALRAEIDEAAWASLYRTTSRPFDAPPTGKIAVKVINHYGDEVLKVYAVG